MPNAKGEEPDTGPPEANQAHTWTRDQKLAAAGIIVALIVGGVTALIAANGGSSPDAGTTASRGDTTAASTTPRRSQTQQQQPAPLLSANATCASVRQAAVIGGARPRRIYADSPGEISGGPTTMEAHLMSNKQWTAWLHVRAGEEVELGVRLFDGNYGSVDDVRVSARIVERTSGCWRLGGAVHYATDRGLATPLGPMLIQAQPGQRVTGLTYVPRSTRLLDQHDKELTKLPDGVLGAGTALPYSVPPAALDIYYVNFRMKVN